MVEARGFEPLTPCLQSRCSPTELSPQEIKHHFSGSPPLGQTADVFCIIRRAMDTARLAAEYLAECDIRGLATKTTEQYAWALVRLEKDCPTLPCTDVEVLTIVGDPALKLESRRDLLKSLRVFFRWAHRRHQLPNPCDGLQPLPRQLSRAANNTPDFRTISDFRKDHLAALTGLFLQVLAFCQRAGLVKLGHVALDGTKVRANASRHKAMSYRRMKEKEEQLAAEVAELLRRAQEVDDEEDRRYGKDKRGDELPEELAFREGRLEKIREAMAALEAEAQAEAEARSIPGCPRTRLSATSPMPSPASCPGRAVGTSCKRTTVRRWLTTPTRSSWRLGPPTSPRTSSRLRR